MSLKSEKWPQGWLCCATHEAADPGAHVLGDHSSGPSGQLGDPRPAQTYLHQGCEVLLVGGRASPASWVLPVKVKAVKAMFAQKPNG